MEFHPPYEGELPEPDGDSLPLVDNKSVVDGDGSFVDERARNRTYIAVGLWLTAISALALWTTDFDFSSPYSAIFTTVGTAGLAGLAVGLASWNVVRLRRAEAAAAVAGRLNAERAALVADAVRLSHEIKRYTTDNRYEWLLPLARSFADDDERHAFIDVAQETIGKKLDRLEGEFDELIEFSLRYGDERLIEVIGALRQDALDGGKE